MNLKKLLAIVASVMLLMSLTVIASAADTCADTAPAAVTDCAAARLGRLEARVQDLVSAGTITQTQADALMARVRTCMANCDGTGCDNQGLCNGTGCDNQGRCDGTGCDNQNLCDKTGTGICSSNTGNSHCDTTSRSAGHSRHAH